MNVTELPACRRPAVGRRRRCVCRGVYRLLTVVGPDVEARQDEVADAVYGLVSGPPRRVGA